ncbi:MAG: hypothetical protein KGD61_06765 [Candidatus Lokiarchaeota archaeon]|nr:hypothetical protein [Candidatus Lokiarchaeota archaeon]
MITWILGTFILVFVLYKRFIKDGRVDGYPLGMPRGTVRAIITLMIVLFPFTYILWDAQIPSEVVNTIFLLVAFYFEARKGEDNRLKFIAEIKNPEKAVEEKRKTIKPLYLPKYTVRISLMIILIIYYLIDLFIQSISLELTNTLIDILIIAILYFIGSFFRTLGQLWSKKKLKEHIEAISNYKELSKYDILEKLNESKRGGANNVFKTIFSIIVFLAVTVALLLFTAKIDFILIFNVSLRRALLLLINLYYGFRD